MDINDVIDWLGRRDDIVIAQPEKFYGELKERFQAPDTEGGFLEEIGTTSKEIRDRYINEGCNRSLLVLASEKGHCSSVWGGSIAEIASTFASAAAEDHDYVRVLELSSKALLMKAIRERFLNDDTD